MTFCLFDGTYYATIAELSLYIIILYHYILSYIIIVCCSEVKNCKWKRQSTLACPLLPPSLARGPFGLCISSGCSLAPLRASDSLAGQGISPSFILLTNQLRQCVIFIGHKYFIG